MGVKAFESNADRDEIMGGQHDNLVLIGGGVRAGKSRFALALAQKLGPRRLFVATAIGFDAEMQERIAAHRAERGAEFETIEAPYELSAVLRAARDVDVIVVDCLTLWLSNLLLREQQQAEAQQHEDARAQTEARIGAAIDELAQVVARRSCHLVIVTNEVGMGVVPESALGRRFRDLAGRAHQRLARESDEVYFALLGMILRIKPGLAIEGGNDAESA